MARLEAVLFLAREPLSSRRLAKMANLPDGTKARTLLRELREMYRARGSAFQVEEVAGGFQLLTRPAFAPWLRRLDASSSEVRLSAPAMETLAVVAYRQPVLRAEIEAIRGVQCGEILRQLMDRDLARIVGRADDLGRPFLYGTTKRFLQLFGLRDLDELPRAEELRAVEIGPSPPVAKEAVESNDMPTARNNGSEKQEVSPVVKTTMEPGSERLQEEDPRRLVAQYVDEEEDDFEDEDLEEDDDFDDDDDEDDDLEDDEDDLEDDDLEEDDLDEEEEEEDDLEGEWEEVEDDDDEEEEDDLDEDDDEDWDEEEEEEEAEEEWD